MTWQPLRAAPALCSSAEASGPLAPLGFEPVASKALDGDGAVERKGDGSLQEDSHAGTSGIAALVPSRETGWGGSGRKMKLWSYRLSLIFTTEPEPNHERF